MDKSKYFQICETLLGCRAIGIEVVIITPIKSVFQRFEKNLNCATVNDKGFFNNVIFETANKRKGMLIRVPEGIAAQDVMYAFSNIDIFFFGYAGGLLEKEMFGTVVEVSTAIDVDGVMYPLKCSGLYKSAVCGYSPCLLGQLAQQYSRKMRRRKCEVVDMEVVYCTREALQNSNHITAYLLITDVPGKINFWELENEEKSFLKVMRDDAICKISNYINLYS